MKEEIIVFHPDINKHPTNNEYTKKMYELVSSIYKVRSLEWFATHILCGNVKGIYLNWYENTVGPQNTLIQQIQYALKYLLIKFAKIRGIKVVYVVHNKTPHNISKSSDIYIKAAKPFIRKALLLSDKIVELSRHTEQYLVNEYQLDSIANKISLVPHGTYTKYESVILNVREKYKIKNNEFVFCFVGKMDKYKNVDIIIKAFYEADINARLLLIGKIDNDYKKQVTELIVDNRVICDFSFVSDEDMSAIMQAVNVIVLPYSNTSMNSGIMINAFSNGVTVVGTNIEMLMDYPENLVYGYYHSEENHVVNLRQRMKDAYQDYKNGNFEGKGAMLEDIVNKDNNWGKVKHSLLKVFR